MKKAKGIMLQGTASDVGKTILATALCRIFKEDGYRVAPFKAQNMTLNSYITFDGLEMGVAQALQAEAAGVLPKVEMSPIILKPKGEMEAQVVIMGKPLQEMTAKNYRREYLPKARLIVQNCIEQLQSDYEVLVIEGAGSAAEVNLKDGDIVNMATAEMADSPVLLVADIDRGGVFASIIGTLDLLTEAERERVVGLVINKFRGDLDLFRSGIEFLEERTGKPILGVIPYLEHNIDDEDSTSLNHYQAQTGDLEIAVLQLPRIANFSDLHRLSRIPGVMLRYVRGRESLGSPAAVIVPDTANPLADLDYLRAKGYQKELEALVAQGVPVLGIGAGCQLLGNTITANDGSAGAEGLGFLSLGTSLLAETSTRRIDGSITYGQGEPWDNLIGIGVKGFELNSSQMILGSEVQVLLTMDEWPALIGTKDALILGTNLHGFLDNTELLLAWLNELRHRQGLALFTSENLVDLDRELAFEQLGSQVREHLNMPLLYQLMGLPVRDEEC